MLCVLIVLVFVLTAGILSAEGGGEQLYKHKFIKGSDPNKMVLNEDKMLTREQLALLIIEINGIKNPYPKKTVYELYDDFYAIGDWSKDQVALCYEKGFMKGMKERYFNPGGLVPGKQLGAVMLRALGYQEVDWAGVDKKLAELNIPIKDEPLTRGQAFDYIWKVLNLPIMKDGNTLAFKLDKIVPGRMDLPQVEFMDKKGTAYTVFEIPYTARWAQVCKQYFFMNEKSEYVLLNIQHGVERVFIRTYTKDWKPVKTLELPSEGELFGGFYEAKDYYYMVFGNTNEEQDDHKTVLKLVKYDKNFNKLDSLDINHAYTVTPFDAGSLRMAETDGFLAIHTARLRYDGHQSQLTVVVDTKNMKVLNELGSFQTNHVSHSFDQYVFYDNKDRLILFDHGDGYPRALALQVFEKDGRNFYQSISTENPYPKKKEGENYFEFLRFPGVTGANVTGTSIGNIVEGSKNYIMSTNRMNYNEAIQKNYVFDSYKVVNEKGREVDFRNVYIDFIDKDTFHFTTKQLTSDATKLENYSIPKIVRLKNDRIMVIWEKKYNKEERGYLIEKDREVQYVVMDEEGNTKSPVQILPKHRLFEVDPIYSCGKVMWIVDDGGTNNANKEGYEYKGRLYTIDVDTAWLK